jgi:hypothetical protein
MRTLTSTRNFNSLTLLGSSAANSRVRSSSSNLSSNFGCSGCTSGRRHASVAHSSLTMSALLLLLLLLSLLLVPAPAGTRGLTKTFRISRLALRLLTLPGSCSMSDSACSGKNQDDEVVTIVFRQGLHHPYDSAQGPKPRRSYATKQIRLLFGLLLPGSTDPNMWRQVKHMTSTLKWLHHPCKHPTCKVKLSTQ